MTVHIDFEAIDAHGGLGLACHAGELVAVVADVGHLMGHDEVMLRIDGGLDIVANHPPGAPAGRHRSRIRIGQRYLLIGRVAHRNTTKTA